MAGALFGIAIFLACCFGYSFVQTKKRCRMFYYLELLEIAMRYSSEDHPTDAIKLQCNILAYKIDWAKNPDLSEKMEQFVVTQFSGNNNEFMRFAKSQGFEE